jgi:hypothetical protein
MEIDLYASLIAALTVAILSVQDFHRPVDIRFSVTGRRYLFSVALYVTVCVLFFFFVLIVAYAMMSYYMKDYIKFPKQIAVASALLITILVSLLPGTRALVNGIRRSLFAVAMYPTAIEALIVAIAEAPFSPHQATRRKLGFELGRYGVSDGETNASKRTALTPSAFKSLEEACSLRISFSEFESKSEFDKFLNARAEVLADIEVGYQRLLRWSARAMLDAEDVEACGDNTEFVPASSDIIAEESELIIGRYQRLVAEAALSNSAEPTVQRDLIRTFGYNTAQRFSLPFYPLVVVFGLDFLVSLAPIFMARYGLKPFSDFPLISMRAAVIFACTHACCQTIAIAWAIYPKAISNFARPSLFALPWLSYVLFGLASYVSGLTISGLLSWLVTLDSGTQLIHHPILINVASAMFFLVVTVMISLLIDLRIRSRSFNFSRGRLFDAIALGAAMVATTIFFQIVGLWLIGDFWPPLTRRLIFISLFGSLGLLMGYLIPGTAAAHLNAKELYRGKVEPSDNRMIEQLNRRKAGN